MSITEPDRSGTDDPRMATTVPRPSATDAISYEDLYARWERGNWRATEIDFSQDAVDWHERLTEEQRRSALWLYALFFHGEDSVADNLSPYIDAAPTEEQTYFLTTQQVDEARHSVLFKRFMHEVVGRGDGGAPTMCTTSEARPASGIASERDRWSRRVIIPWLRP